MEDGASSRDAAARLWPLYGLRIRTAGVELRYPAEDDLLALAELNRGEIHDPAVMPFSVPWSDQPPDVRARSTLQWHWRCRAEWSAAEWHLELVAVRDGRVVGTQGLHAVDFARSLEVDTGSWVARPLQGRGIGTAMRRALLHLAFAGLGAETARSGAFSDNAAILRVSERLGYVRDGSTTVVRRGVRSTMVRLVVTREVWERESASWPAVEMHCLGPCLSLFGVGAERGRGSAG